MKSDEEKRRGLLAAVDVFCGDELCGQCEWLVVLTKTEGARVAWCSLFTKDDHGNISNLNVGAGNEVSRCTRCLEAEHMSVWAKKAKG